MNHITEAWAYLMAHWIEIPLSVSVVVLIAAIALVVNYKRAHAKNRAAQELVDWRESKRRIEAGRKLQEAVPLHGDGFENRD